MSFSRIRSNCGSNRSSSSAFATLFSIASGESVPRPTSLRAQFFYRRRLYEHRKGIVPEDALEVDTALDVYVEEYDMALGPYSFDLRLQCSVK